MNTRIIQGMLAGMLGVFLSTAAGAASSPDRLMKELRDVAGAIRSGRVTEEDLGKAGLPKDRRAVLSGIYFQLSGLSYHEALKEGTLSRQETDRVARRIDTLGTRQRTLLTQSGFRVKKVPAGSPWYTAGFWGNLEQALSTDSVGNEGGSSNQPEVTAAVRGGREVRNVDKTIFHLDKSLPDAPKGRRALLYEREGEAYAKLAGLYRNNFVPPSRPLPSMSRSGFDPASLYQADSPGVVVILALNKNGNGELGSGIIINQEGQILTNAHVLTDKTSGALYPVINVYFRPDTVTGDYRQDLTNPLQATIGVVDHDLDLAVLNVGRLPADSAVLSLGRSRRIVPGTSVVAIGHPEQGGLWTLTKGIVSARIDNANGVPGKNMFQTDASINRGNSGGPLIDAGGAVIGVNTEMARKGQGGLTITSVNFAIRSDVARKWLRKNGIILPAAAVPPPPSVTPVREERPAPPPPTPSPQPSAPSRIVTPGRTSPRPYREADVISAEEAKLENMANDMEQEIRKHLEKPSGTAGGAP